MDIPYTPLPPYNPDSPNAPYGSRPSAPTSEQTDTAVQGWLNALGGAVSANDKTQLAQVGNDATTLLDFFKAYPNGAPQLNKNIPPAVAAAEKRLLSDDAIKKQLVVGSGPDKGLVTRYTVSAFLTSLDKAASAAQSSWGSFSNGDPAVKRIAVDASILQADSPILDEAGAGSKLDGEISTQDLQAVASSSGDAGLPDALKNAAALFSSPGMFSNLDIAGDDPATTKPDGLMDSGNLGAFIAQELPKMTATTAMSMIGAAANQNMVSGVNVSKLGPDVFKNPQNYSGAQKAAVLIQLENLQVAMNAGVKGGLWDPGQFGPFGEYASLGINPDAAGVQADIQSKINQLSQDPSVQTFISAHSTASLQAITGADPGLKSALQSDFDNGPLQDGSALKAALDAKGSNGKPVTAEQGLASFLGQVSPWAEALGSGGKPANLNLREAAQKSGEDGKLEAAYKADILSGNELKTAIAGGTPIGQAVQQFMSDAANFSAVLPSSFIKQNAATLQNNFSNTLSDSLLGSATQGGLNAAFADKNGNLDTAKLTAVLQQIEKQDPDAFKDSQGVSIPPDKIVSAFKYVWDEVRQSGGKLPDALAKAKIANWGIRNPAIGPQTNPQTDPKPSKPSGPLAAAYSSGMMHIVSALFGAGVLAAKGAEGGSASTLDPNLVAGSFQVVGGLMEGGSKYGSTYLKSLPKGAAPKPWVPSESTFKSIESAGKALGGTGGIIAGAVSIFGGVQALDSGEKVEAGLDLSSGITQVLSGGASAAEGVAGFLDVGDVVAAALGTTSSILGGVAAGVGVLAVIGLAIYEAVEWSKTNGAFDGLVVPQLQQWGITGANGPHYPPPPPPPPLHEIG